MFAMRRMLWRRCAVALLLVPLVGCQKAPGVRPQPAVAEQPSEEEMENAYEKIVGGRIEYADEALRRGAEALREGKKDLALLYYIRAAELEPANLTALRSVAALYDERGEKDRAAVFYGLVLKYVPDDADALEKVGDHLLKNRDFDGARTHFARAVDVDPERWRAFNAMGVIADLARDHVSARKHYAAALTVRPDAVSVLNNVGYSQYLSGELDAAREYLSRALNLASKDERVIQNLALVEARSGNSDLAVNLFSRVSAREQALNDVGYIRMLEGDYASAIEYFESAIEKSPAYYPRAVANLKRARELGALDNQDMAGKTDSAKRVLRPAGSGSKQTFASEKKRVADSVLNQEASSAVEVPGADGDSVLRRSAPAAQGQDSTKAVQLSPDGTNATGVLVHKGPERGAAAHVMPQRPAQPDVLRGEERAFKDGTDTPSASPPAAEAHDDAPAQAIPAELPIVASPPVKAVSLHTDDATAEMSSEPSRAGVVLAKDTVPAKAVVPLEATRPAEQAGAGPARQLIPAKLNGGASQPLRTASEDTGAGSISAASGVALHPDTASLDAQVSSATVSQGVLQAADEFDDVMAIQAAPDIPGGGAGSLPAGALREQSNEVKFAGMPAGTPQPGTAAFLESVAKDANATQEAPMPAVEPGGEKAAYGVSPAAASEWSATAYQRSAESASIADGSLGNLPPIDDTEDDVGAVSDAEGNAATGLEREAADVREPAIVPADEVFSADALGRSTGPTSGAADEPGASWPGAGDDRDLPEPVTPGVTGGSGPPADN